MTGPKQSSILEMRTEGLFCPPGGFYIDPMRAVARAVVTHAHADHLRKGARHLIATPETCALADARLGRGGYGEATALEYGERMQLGDASIWFAPAGHCLGSAQVVIEAAGQRAVITGDFKRDVDPSCPPFELVKCDLFVTEATFGLPVWRFPPAEGEIARLTASLRRFPDRTHVIAAYSLGKAQRLIAELRQAGHSQPIYIHRAMTSVCEVYKRFGRDLGTLLPVEKGDASLAGAVVFAPPGGSDDAWRGRLRDPVTVSASGWNRGGRRAGGSELSLTLSDHSDWNALTQTIAETEATEVWIDHGPPAGLAHWCAERGISTKAVNKPIAGAINT
ncbi:MAG: ligase-associated DNA damage response exonuclease [Pikeienuella sp.]